MEVEATGERARSSSGILAGGDRLSALPDCLIHHIMSFMKARQVVQTCVLSTRWRHLWRSVPCLDVDIEEFNTADENHDSDEEWEKFEDFTDHLLTNNIAIALLDTFQLHVGYRYHRDEQAARWIRHGIKYSAQAPGGIQRDRGLWRLKRLHLSHVHLDDRFAKHVSKGCRSLEDLELSGCSCEIREITSHSVKNMVLKDCTWIGLSAITSPALKSLVIDGGSISGPSSPLVVTAPAVAYLLIMALWSCSFVAGISINEMPSLVKASIQLPAWSVKGVISRKYFLLISGLTNVTTLELSDFKMTVQDKFSVFKNLRTLLLNKCDLSDNFQLLRQFMQNSPNMEKLTLRCCTLPKCPAGGKGKVKSKKTSCQFQNLVDFQCRKLESAEIIYNDGDNIRELMSALPDISDHIPKNTITLTKA